MTKTEEYINLKHPIEKELFALFEKNEDLIFFDIGCCEAEDSIRYSNMFKNAIIFSFEALESNYLLSQQNITKFKKEKNIRLFNFALSDSVGEADFYVSSGKPEEHKNVDFNFGNKSSSLLSPHKVSEHFNWLKFKTKEKVKTDTLNNFCKNELISMIDLMHIDVQGAEKLVLTGADTFLNHTRAIWIEVELEELYKGQPLKKDIESYLNKFGFVPAKTIVNSVAGDVLFLNQKYFHPSKNIVEPKKNNYELIKNKIKYKLNLPEHYQKISYSQNGEDLLIKKALELLKIINPTYIDIGANHPYHFNNTAIFYQNGARGINIEPNTNLFSLFEKHRKDDINLNIGVNDKNGEIDYFEFDSDTLNTCSETEASNYEKLGYSIKNKRKIKVLTIDDIIKKHHGGVFPDILTLDVEGLDEKILRSLSFESNYPKIICVETIKFDTKFDIGNKSKTITNFLLEKGYHVFADTFINTILIKK